MKTIAHVVCEYRYFTRTIYQFQFQKALCDAAGHTDALSKCDITGSIEAGTKLRYEGLPVGCHRIRCCCCFGYPFNRSIHFLFGQSIWPFNIKRELMTNFCSIWCNTIVVHMYKCSSNLSSSSSSMFSVRNMLELGRSQSWTRALQTISGGVKMDARPLLDYFETLHNWLKAENQKHNRTVGWKAEIDPCEYKRYSYWRVLPQR